MVQVEVSDDGRGVDPDGLVARAVADGVLSPADAEQLTPRQALDLMFLPGLSTNDSVTNVSGRGVGMDVVASEVRQLGGTLDIASIPGSGTTFTLRLPQTLAVTQAVFVKIGATRTYYDVQLAVKAGADVIVLDGMQGGTAATQDVFIEHVGIPTLPAVRIAAARIASPLP